MRFDQIFHKIDLYCQYIKTHIFYGLWLQSVGKHSILYSPMRIMNAHNIIIGDRTVIEKEATLYSVQSYANISHKGTITIGNNVYINHHFNATAANSIVIKDDVLMAYNVSIFDFNHGYEDINSNINKTPLLVSGPVVVGERSWIGMNVAIIGQVNIGKHCIIGANSVVTKDIPDYCIAVGNPARVIKRYNKQTSKWEKVE